MLHVWREVLSHKSRGTQGLWSRSPQPFPACVTTMFPWALLLHNNPAAEKQLAVFYRKKTYSWIRAFTLN